VPRSAPAAPWREDPLTRTRVDQIPSGTRRLAWLRAVVAVLAVAGLAALLVTGTPRAARPTWMPGQSPGTPHAGGTPSQVPPPPTAAPGAGTSALPAGWHWYRDRTGFTVAVPDGWAVSRRGSIVYFRAPDGSRLLGIDQTDQPQPDPVADWTGKEQYRVAHGDFPGYQRIKIAPVDYFVKAADWEFTYLRGGRRVHVVNRGVITSAHQAYGFWWQTADSSFAANLADFRTVTASFQPRAA
jgi:hypothetical protein